MLNLYGYCDADWGVAHEDRRSVSGYCVYLGQSLICWSSKRQSVVSLSSTESEYRAVADSTSELLWVSSLLQELKCPVNLPYVIWFDNIGAASLATNPIYHSRTNHVEIDVHFIRDKVAAKVVEVRYVPTYDQTADRLTMALTHHRLSFLRSKLGDVKIPSSLQWGVKA